MISFYDFDQDHADHGRAFVRESLYVADFTSMYISPNTSLEFNFSHDIWQKVHEYPSVAASLQPGGSLHADYRGGILPMTTFDSWDWSQDRRLSIHRPIGWQKGAWPPTNASEHNADFIAGMEAMYAYNATMGQNYSGPYIVSEAQRRTLYMNGVLMRSTEQGEGAPAFPKHSWIGCQGDCQSGRTPDQAVCNMATYTCSGNGGWGGTTPWGGACSGVDSRCGPSQSRWNYTDFGVVKFHMRRGTPSWTGCGFRHSGLPAFDPRAPYSLRSTPNEESFFGQFRSFIGSFKYPVGCHALAPPYWQTGRDVYATPYETGLYDDNVACILDCPRTSVPNDCKCASGF
jgi:hypothetical protein